MIITKHNKPKYYKMICLECDWNQIGKSTVKAFNHCLKNNHKVEAEFESKISFTSY